MQTIICRKFLPIFHRLTEIVLALIVMVLAAFSPTTARADATVMWDAPGGTIGWCTVAGTGHNECFGDPMAACKVQFDYYAGDTDFYGVEGGSRWDVMQCVWKYRMGGSFPAPVTFLCADGYIKAGVGRCVQEDFTLACCRPGVPDPYTEHPINLLTGAKVLIST